ncbi:MAG: chorismate mutase [Candidatus Thermoplasmatota archaeon]|nr:chorismate mutase [Candidatus Thermoplasmatota archaeon]MDA8144259.1 chorismate mutase [Thermoplasmatales archaeon]
MEVIHFIRKINGENELGDLRTLLLQNSSEIVSLFKQRAELAKRIGIIKRELGLPSRIRERETEVMKEFDDSDYFGRSILLSLFEFTIANEEAIDIVSTSGNNGEPVKVRGAQDSIQFIAGLLISRPGIEVYSTVELPEHLKKGIQAYGSHIVHGDIDQPDLRVCLWKKDNSCDIAISRDGELSIFTLPGSIPGVTKVKIDS